SIVPKKRIPKVWPVIGTGLNGTGIDNRANSANNMELENAITMFVVRDFDLISCSVKIIFFNINDCKIFIANISD
ncbi:MAG: hypothetical protein KAS35_03210, partial [Candidatus Marinimicrobia bacterium]|nr:hypothetical protein [Candidatus Neomarinimicrobiota bacterium]